MKLTITIKMDNAAFESWQSGSEVARILTNLASSLAGRDLNRSEDSFTLRDINGNVVGEAKVTK
jgi:hypothetical protein